MSAIKKLSEINVDLRVRHKGRIVVNKTISLYLFLNNLLHVGNSENATVASIVAMDKLRNGDNIHGKFKYNGHEMTYSVLPIVGENY